MNAHHQMSPAVHSALQTTLTGDLCAVDLLFYLRCARLQLIEGNTSSYSSICKGQAVHSLLFEESVVVVLAVCHSLAHSGHLGSLGSWVTVVLYHHSVH